MMENEDTLCEKIVKKIKKNKISTTEIADCLGKKGVLPDIYPINKGHFRAGKIFLAYGYNESNWEIHEQLQDVEEGAVVLVETHNCNQKAVFGELVSKYLLLYKEVEGIVINGYMRDAHRLIKENYPIWCEGVTPIGCFNEKNENELESKIIDEWKRKYEGAIAVCDDSGVVVIPKDQITQEFSEKLDFIELQEDIWFYCIDTKKWSTYDTVCRKRYLDTNLLPPELREKFETFVNEHEKDKKK